MAARQASAADQTVYSAWVRGLELALSGTGWVSGGTPSAQGTPDMTVALAAGTYRISGTTYSLAGQNATITTAHATLTRQDLISVDSTGTATVTAGTAAAAPGSGVSYADPPDLPSGHIPIALVEVAAGVSSVLDARIVDIRSIIPLSKDLIDAKGDLLAGTAADTISRLAVGANDTILMADSGEATGLRWQAPATTAEIADSAAAEAAGTSDTWARGDHVHAHGTGYLPDAHHARSHAHSDAADGTTLTPATLNIPNTTTPAQTAEGQAVWDSDDDVLTIGDGTSRKTLVNTAGAQTLTDKTLTSPVINTQLTGTAVGTGASQVAQGSHTTPAATATTAGHVPTPPNNTTTFLRGDMTFAVPAGGTTVVITKVEVTDAFTTTSTSYVLRTGLTTSLTTANASNNVEFIAHIPGMYNNNNNGATYLKINNSTDSTNINENYTIMATGSEVLSGHVYRMATSPASAKTIQCEAKVASGTGNYSPNVGAVIAGTASLVMKEYK